jgi:hypothetical protein
MLLQRVGVAWAATLLLLPRQKAVPDMMCCCEQCGKVHEALLAAGSQTSNCTHLSPMSCHGYACQALRPAALAVTEHELLLCAAGCVPSGHRAAGQRSGAAVCHAF